MQFERWKIHNLPAVKEHDFIADIRNQQFQRIKKKKFALIPHKIFTFRTTPIEATH